MDCASLAAMEKREEGQRSPHGDEGPVPWVTPPSRVPACRWFRRPHGLRPARPRVLLDPPPQLRGDAIGATTVARHQS